MADDYNSREQPGTVAMKWLSEIEAAQRDMQPYRTRCNKIRRFYRYDSSRTAKRRRFQLFWSNIETMKPAVYAQTPKAVVDTRFRTGNPVARIASQLLERTIQFQFDANDFDRFLKQIRDDYLLYARGVPRLRYEAVFEEADVEDGLAEAPQEQRAEAEEAGPTEVLAFENVRLDYVQREDFIHPKGRTWEELPWLAYRAYLTGKQFKERFPDYPGAVPLNSSESRETNDGQPSDSETRKAEIFEIWDKVNQRVLWVAKGCAEVLEEGAPYLKLNGFYPSPRPAYGTLTNDSLEPIPDFIFYQDQTEEIDDLTNRIAALTDALKLIGFYPAGPQGEGAPEIERAMTPGVENKMIAVKSWAAFTDKAQGGAPIVWLPVDQVAKIIVECINLRKQLKDDVREITGISDLMRGDTDPNETAHAQNLKAQYGSSRMGDRKKELARVARDIVSMAGEIIAEQFQLSTMMEVSETQLPTRQDVAMQQQQAALEFQKAQSQWQQAAQTAQQQGQQPPPQPQPPQVLNNLGPTQEDVQELLRNGVLRRFRLDIETDSTVSADETQEKQDRTEFLQAVSQFMTVWGPMVQQQPDLAPMACQFLLFGVRAFPVARELQNVIEETTDKLMAMAGQPKQPPQPSPDEQIKMETAKIKGQAEIQKANTEAQTSQFEAQAKMGQTKMEMDRAAQEHQMGMEAMQTDHAIKMRTLEQQVLMDERRMVAQDAVNGMLRPKNTGQP